MAGFFFFFSFPFSLHPHPQQSISNSFSLTHEDTFPGTRPGGWSVLGGGGGQLAGDWEQGHSVHLWGPQKNGELALSSPVSALPFAALSLCCPQVASWAT